MKFVKERVNVICQELARLSISQKIKITDMQVKNGCYITPAEADASKEPWTSFDTVNDRWYGPDKHYWFRTTITIPESFDGKNLWMRVHAGLDDWDDGRNPQFLLFVDGKVTQGVDMNHRDILLDRCAKGDIDAAWDAVKCANHPRIHVFLATSDIHMEYKQRMTRQQVLQRITEMVGYAASLCPDIEFSAEDASRSDPAFLAQCYANAIAAGATTLNVPDTVGYSTPQEMSGLITYLREHVLDPLCDRLQIGRAHV